MKYNGKHYRTTWMEEDKVLMIEQNLLPFEFSIYTAQTWKESAEAIRTMIVRGAGAIGGVAGYAMAQACLQATPDNYLTEIEEAKDYINATRPTAQNLFYATKKVFEAGKESPAKAVEEAEKLAQEGVDDGYAIGKFGASLIEDGFKIETHCNAGWLAFVDWGSALSPMYVATQEEGKEIFVWVDETRPRSQGARLTAWELFHQEIPHKIIPDNAGAHLMSKGEVDMIIVGADRIAANGDVANKIGTLEKAIAAKEFGIPFYVAAPVSTIDFDCPNGNKIPIEERSMDEVLYQDGPNQDGVINKTLVCSPGSEAYNPAFDVTPAKFISGIITNKGIIKAKKEEIQKLRQI
jgi:S-methyl-5-thioribose-1-phosphate isomerase